LTATEQVTATLRYLCKAAEAIEAHVAATGEVPPWVYDRVQRAAVNLGMAASYTQKKTQKKEIKPSLEPKKLKKEPA
jgi:hypothetical protein